MHQDGSSYKADPIDLLHPINLKWGGGGHTSGHRGALQLGASRVQVYPPAVLEVEDGA